MPTDKEIAFRLKKSLGLTKPFEEEEVDNILSAQAKNEGLKAAAEFKKTHYNKERRKQNGFTDY